MTRSATLIFPGGDLTVAELQSAWLDGHLRPLGFGFVPAETEVMPWHRAQSLRPLVDDTNAVVALTAAWVHGAAGDLLPLPVAVQRAVAWHTPRILDVRVRYHDRQVPETDLVVLGGVAVTTPIRTLVDISRELSSTRDRRSSSMQLSTAATNLAHDEPTLHGATAWFHAHPRTPHSIDAVGYLGELAQEDFARYTS